MPVALPDEVVRRINAAWPDARAEDCLVIMPLGGRHDALIFCRTNGQVTTGTRVASGYCYRGTLDEFAAEVERDYGERLETPEGNHALWLRLRDEYRAAVAFLRLVGV